MNTTNRLHGKVVMLDLSSPEVNRGSFCYLSYLLYSAFSSQAAPQIKEVHLHEEFRISDLDKIQSEIDSADSVIVGLWSYPQIDAALLLNRFLKGRCWFYGYYPLIEHLGLRAIYYTEEHLLEGLRQYPSKVAKEAFEFDLLSDCDKHIKDSAKYTASGIEQKMVPMFTSYGCPMGCTFCSATVNCKKKRISLDIDTVVQNLYKLELHGKRAIHFTDEDFFYNPMRAAEILLAAYHVSPHFEFIALGGMHTVNQFCDYVEQNYNTNQQDWIWHCLRLIEIGLETVDPALASAMGKGGRSSALKAILVQKKCRCKVLWLTVTFYPGETIGSLNATGFFLKEHGLAPAEMEERIVTNGTEGGLGQFFQFYHGAGLTEEELEDQGVNISPRPMRLIPSFIPNSFIYSNFIIDWDELEARHNDLHYWLNVYGYSSIPDNVWAVISDENTPADATYNIELFLEMMPCISNVPYIDAIELAIFIAIAARLNIFKGV